MSDLSPIRWTHLSQLLGAQAGEATSRRTFLERASALSLVIGGSALFPFVNHGFGHGQKGAIGFLVMEDF